MKNWIAAAAFAAGLLASPAAFAGFDGFNADDFKPAIDPFGYVTVNGARSLDMFQIHAAGYFNWAKDPLEFSSGLNVPRGRDIIRELTMLDLVGGIGLIKLGKHGGLEAGVDLPIALENNGLRVDVSDRSIGLKDHEVGTLRTELKLTALDREDDIVGIAVRAFAEWAIGNDENFLTEEDDSFAGTIIVEKKISIVRFGVELGYQYIDGRIRLANVTVDDKILLGLGVAIEPIENISVVGELHHWTRIDQPWDHSEESPFELGGAIKYTGTLFALLGASGGLNDGVGAPEARIFFSVGITF